MRIFFDKRKKRARIKLKEKKLKDKDEYLLFLNDNMIKILVFFSWGDNLSLTFSKIQGQMSDYMGIYEPNIPAFTPRSIIETNIYCSRYNGCW